MALPTYNPSNNRVSATRGENVTSEKQDRANRQNARKSTGPKTPEGKAAVRHNAVKHGLLAEEVLILGEDEAAFKDLDERLRNELQPVGELEDMLVDRIVVARWRLRRLGRVEADIFHNLSRASNNWVGPLCKTLITPTPSPSSLAMRFL